MGREIKFRAWHKQERKMKEVELLQLCPFMRIHVIFLGNEGHEDIVSTWNPEDCELMQFTGLLDKNGKEIYEGDIVTLPGKPAGEVRWNTSGVEFYVYGSRGADYQLHSDWKIVSNIYEHPELIEEAKQP